VKIINEILNKSINFNNKTRRIIAIVFIIVSIILLSFLKYPVIFTNTMVSQGNPDQVEYHTCAVNQALGYGFLTGGKMNDSIDYKIECSDNQCSFQHEELGGLLRLDRFPAYSFCAAYVYKIAKINPAIIKYLQWVLVCILLLLLPFMCFKFWGEKGFFGALLSTPFIYCYLFEYIDDLTPDIISVFFNVIVLYFYAAYRIRFEKRSLFLLFIILGVSFLFKASLLFFIVFMFIDLLIINYKKGKKDLMRFALFFIIFLLCWLPYNIWSISVSLKQKEITSQIIEKINKTNPHLDELNKYINKNIKLINVKIKNASFTIEDVDYYKRYIKPEFDLKNYIEISQLQYFNQNLKLISYIELIDRMAPIYFMQKLYQGFNLLDLNNEYNNDGDYHPEWILDKNSYYHNDGFESKPHLFRVLMFYWHKPNFLLSIPHLKQLNYLKKNKILFFFIISSQVLIMLISVFSFIENHKTQKQKIISIIKILVCFTAIILLFKFKEHVYFYLSILCIGLCVSEKTLKKYMQIPFILMFTSMFLFPLITYGNSRYMIYYDTFFFVFTFIFLIESVQRIVIVYGDKFINDTKKQ